MTTWTTPKTWVTGDPLTASEMNTHVRDNEKYLADPAGRQSQIVNAAADYVVTSATFVKVDPANADFTVTFTPIGTTALICFSGLASNDTLGVQCFFDLELNGTRVNTGGNDGITGFSAYVVNYRVNISFTRMLTGLTAGVSYTVRLMARTTGGNLKVYAGAGTAGGDVQPQLAAWI